MNSKYLEKIVIKTFDKPFEKHKERITGSIDKVKEYYDKYMKYKKKYLVSKQ